MKYHLYELGPSSQLEVAVIFAYGVEAEALVFLNQVGLIDDGGVIASVKVVAQDVNCICYSLARAKIPAG